jgi:hypothetical protein
MANLLQSAQVEQISADSGIPSVSLHQRGLVLALFFCNSHASGAVVKDSRALIAL